MRDMYEDIITDLQNQIEDLMDEILILDNPESMREVAHYVKELLRSDTIRDFVDLEEEDRDDPWKYRGD